MDDYQLKNMLLEQHPNKIYDAIKTFASSLLTENQQWKYFLSLWNIHGRQKKEKGKYEVPPYQ